LEDHYTIEKELGSGTYGRVVLARCHATCSEVALKILPKSVKLRDVIREFNYSYYLSPHTNVVSTFDVAFETSTAYVFAQEHAPLGDLFEAITPRAGLYEKQAKIVATQIASALEFMHSRCLVHRDVKVGYIYILYIYIYIYKLYIYTYIYNIYNYINICFNIVYGLSFLNFRVVYEHQTLLEDTQ